MDPREAHEGVHDDVHLGERRELRHGLGPERELAARRKALKCGVTSVRDVGHCHMGAPELARRGHEAVG